MADPTSPITTDPATEAAFQNIDAPQSIPSASPPPPAAPSGPIQVVSPDGKLGSIPGEQLNDAIAEGYRQATPDDVHEHKLQAQYGTPRQQVLAGLEGAGEAATFGASTALERGLGVPGEDITGRREANPGTHMAGQIAGLGLSGLTGVGEAAALEGAGNAAARAVGLAAPESALAKVGSSAVKAAAENVLAQSGDEASKLFAGDPHQTAQTALTDIGLSGLIGGGVGGGFGTVEPLWRATVGNKLAGVLHTLSERTGGIEGQEGKSAISELVQKTGMDIAPEIQAGVAGDPVATEWLNTLNQSDTTKSGRALQETMKDFHNQAGDVLSVSLGKSPTEVPDIFDKYNAGKKIGHALAEEYETQIAPVKQVYEDYASKFKNAELSPSIADKSEEAQKAIVEAQKGLQSATNAAVKAQTAGDVEGSIQAAAKVNDAREALKAAQLKAKTPGTVDSLLEKIGDLATREGWTISPSSDIMREVGRIQKELPNAKTINDLSNYIKSVGTNMQSDPFKGELVSAGAKIKEILRRAEGDLIGNHVGSEEGAEALAKYTANRQAFAQQAALKDQLDSALHAKGSVSGYGKSVKAMANSDGETVFNRLSGKNDAATLALLQKNFPKTAEAVRQAHLEEILSKAKSGEDIAPHKVLASLNKLSPQLRDFVVPKEMTGRVTAIEAILNKIKEMPHNFSNTARTADKLFQYVPAAALSLVSLMSGHNPLAALALAPLTKYLSKDAPDAIKLAMLKFMGSSAPIEAGAFKTAVDYAKSTIAGENLTSRATKNLFKAGREILPQSAMPKEKDRAKLDKSLQSYQENPNKMMELGGNTGHYLPEHAAALSSTATNAIQLLNAMRPGETKRAPLDKPQKPTPAQQSQYNRALDIAQQPLIVLKHIKDGTLHSGDVQLMQKLYPSLYARLQQKIMDAAADHGDEEIPYSTKIGLSVFTGQPLDSTLTPNAIVSAQPKPQGGAPSGQPNAPVKHKTAALTKLPKQYQTASQASEADNNSRDT